MVSGSKVKETQRQAGAMGQIQRDDTQKTNGNCSPQPDCGTIALKKYLVCLIDHRKIVHRVRELPHREKPKCSHLTIRECGL